MMTVTVGKELDDTGTDSAMIGVCDIKAFDKACGPDSGDQVQEAIEAQTGKIWQEGCGDFETAAPSGAPDPSAPAVAPQADIQVYLDLADWDADHPAWQESNRAWLEHWAGREAELNANVRVPFPGPIDAPFAPGSAGRRTF